MFKIIVKFCLGVLLILLFIVGIEQVNAQSDPALRSEVYSLRNRIERLETQVRQLNSTRTPNPQTHRPENSSTPPQVIDGELVGRSDPMFERLATLVIELKERINHLEQRMTTLEQKNNKTGT